MLSDNSRKQLARLSTAELLDAIDKTIEETQATIEILTEEIKLRLMEQAEN